MSFHANSSAGFAFKRVTRQRSGKSRFAVSPIELYPSQAVRVARSAMEH
ncbi:hypothetical protein [Bordetella genomosp. 9]|nr:hypothetical protein [Bordetella genomosp. 9]